jgi:hypothetical protein
MDSRRGQATFEAVLLAAVVAGLALALTAALRGAAADEVAAALRSALRPPAPRHDDGWALTSPSWEPVIRRYAPLLVLERDRYGEDDAVPVDFALCRARSCAGLGAARPVAFVHLVRRPDAAYIHYWLYYPDSRSTHLPDAGVGDHSDDWEGVIVRVRDGEAAARVTAHGGLAGALPWWEPVTGWRPIGPRPRIYRAAGSHAMGFATADIDLAGDRWNGTLGEVVPSLLPADRARSRRARFDPAAVPPWRKRLWTDPDADATGTGERGKEAIAAAAWARLWYATAGRT